MNKRQSCVEKKQQANMDPGPMSVTAGCVEPHCVMLVFKCALENGTHSCDLCVVVRREGEKGVTQEECGGT